MSFSFQGHFRASSESLREVFDFICNSIVHRRRMNNSTYLIKTGLSREFGFIIFISVAFSPEVWVITTILIYWKTHLQFPIKKKYPLKMQTIPEWKIIYHILLFQFSLISLLIYDCLFSKCFKNQRKIWTKSFYMVTVTWTTEI